MTLSTNPTQTSQDNFKANEISGNINNMEMDQFKKEMQKISSFVGQQQITAETGK